MKATTLVKDLGLDFCKIVVKSASNDGEENYYCPCCLEYSAHGETDNHVSIQELKRVLESHESVEKFGGLEEAKRIANNPLAIFNTLPLKQAIADVEACQ
ncbi:hypothetical protein MST16_09115 [Acinetobacter sp. YH16040_T]|uniref:hypothetical protein n=1 Tax=unclassified Acinetobacter TaxID=196816 RepID=UPI0015D1B557|nr:MULTISPECIES: hypothetical protein [unclassified Acinetobacter]UUS56288.1 hypothetical protein MST16_09115 [Acinetobacter sp. YH16040_T]